MLPALALLVATARAADPTPAQVEARYPYHLEIAGEGRNLRLLDLEGRVIPTPDALVLVGLPEAAETYRKAERTRKLAADGIWLGASALGVGSVLLANTSGTGETNALSLAVPYLVPVAIASGFVVRYVNPRPHLGSWTDRETVESAVAAHAAGSGGAPVLDRVAVYEGRQLFIDFDGRVVDAERNPVKMKELLARIDDAAVAQEYKRARRIDKITWISTLGAGGGITALGGFTALIGLVTWSLDGNPGLLQAGGGIALIGLAGVGTGVTGLAVSTAVHDNPNRWFDEPTLRARLDAYDRELREELAIPDARAWQLDVHPILGPGVVGLTGTF